MNNNQPKFVESDQSIDFWSEAEDEDSIIVNKPEIPRLSELMKKSINPKFSKLINTYLQKIYFQIEKINELKDLLKSSRNEIMNFSKNKSSNILKFQKTISISKEKKRRVSVKIINFNDISSSAILNDYKVNQKAGLFNEFRVENELLKNYEQIKGLKPNEDNGDINFIIQKDIQTEVIDKLIISYNEYVVTSKRTIIEFVISCNYDNYLIDKIKSIEYATHKISDTDFFDYLNDYYQGYRELHSIKNERDFYELFGSLERELKQIKNNTDIKLESETNEILSRFLLNQFHKEFLIAVSYFVKKYINEIEWIKKEYQKTNGFRAIRMSIKEKYKNLVVQFNFIIKTFNDNLNAFLEYNFPRLLDKMNSIKTKIGRKEIRLSEEMEKDLNKRYTSFFDNNYDKHLRFLKPEFIKFISQIIPYYYDVDLPFLDYYDYVSNIPQKTYFLFFQIIIKVFTNLVSLKANINRYAFDNSQLKAIFLQINYFKEIKPVFNIFNVSNGNYFDFFLEDNFKTQKIEKSRFPGVNSNRRDLEREIEALNSNIIQKGKLNSSAIKKLILYLQSNKNNKENSETDNSTITSLLEYYSDLKKINSLTEHNSQMNLLKKYLKINTSNLVKFNNKAFLKLEVKLIDLKKRINNIHKQLFKNKHFSSELKQSIESVIELCQGIIIRSA